MAGQIDFALNVENQGFTRGTANASAAIHQLHNDTRTATTSLHAMENVFSIFGSHLAPQLTDGIMTITSQLHALRAAATASGMSFGALGLAGLGLIGILATVSAGIDAVKAKVAEAKSGTALVESLVGNRDELLKVIQKLYGHGKLSQDEAITLQVRLALAPNSADELSAAIASVSKRIREVQGPHIDPKGLAGMNEIAARVRADGLSGKDRVQAELDIAVVGFTAKVDQLGKATGYTAKEIEDLTNRFASQERNKLEAQFLGVDDKADKARNFGAPAGSALERIGFVMNGGGRADPARDTANNTRAMHTEQKITNELLGKLKPATSLLNN